jgi:ADP-ribose pyrophosphatase
MEIINTVLLHSLPYLNLFSRRFRHGNKEGSWYFVSREESPKIHTEKKPNAVFIVAVQGECVILTSEYRVPIGDREISFPAGLIDDGETAAEAAIREFKEETGMELTVAEISPDNLYSTAGMTNESCQIVFGVATGTPSTKGNEDSEDIQVILVPMDKIKTLISDKSQAFSAKAWCILWGLSKANQYTWI